MIIGVISGAMEGGARTKMEPGKLNRYFTFGSYGSDSPDRTELTEMGIAKAARLLGHRIAADQVYVVGDTPGGIEAAHAVGATGIGVATGHYNLDALRDAKAEHVLGSLPDPFPGL